jgi:lipopolysaccharide export system protein LptC
MSVAQAIFNRGNIKFLAALAIPLGIGWLFVYSQKEADIEVAKYKHDQAVKPNTDRVVVDNYTLKEVNDDNQVKWQLLAEKGVVEPDGHEVNLTGVVVEFFEGPELKMRLTAPVGLAIESTKFVKLSAKNGKKVAALGEGGKATLSAETVELKEKNKFLATGGVTIEWPGVAKVTGNSATGAVNVSDLKNFKIMGNTHAVISMH